MLAQRQDGPPKPQGNGTRLPPLRVRSHDGARTPIRKDRIKTDQSSPRNLAITSPLFLSESKSPHAVTFAACDIPLYVLALISQNSRALSQRDRRMLVVRPWRRGVNHARMVD